MVERVDLKWRPCCPGLYVCYLNVAGSLVNSLADWVQLVCSGSSLSKFPSPEGGIQGKSTMLCVVRCKVKSTELVFETLSPFFLSRKWAFKDFTEASNQKLCTNIYFCLFDITSADETCKYIMKWESVWISLLCILKKYCVEWFFGASVFALSFSGRWNNVQKRCILFRDQISTEKNQNSATEQTIK